MNRAWILVVMAMAACGSSHAKTGPSGSGATGGSAATGGSVGNGGADSASSSSSGVTTPPASVTCAAGEADVDGCSCETTTTSSLGANASAVYQGTQCGQTTTIANVTAYCCADPTYPGSGGCTCADSPPGGIPAPTWSCKNDVVGTGGYCDCAYDNQPFNGSTPVPACSTTEGVSQTPEGTVCCSNSAFSCICQLQDACSPGDTQVSDCSTPTSAGNPPYRTSCPAGQVQVTSCSVGLSGGGTTSSAAASSSSGGNCTADGDGCISNAACCGGFCNMGSLKCGCSQPGTSYLSGGACQSDHEGCCSGVCIVASGATAGYCCAPQVIGSSQFGVPPGEACTDSGQCCSQSCNTTTGICY